jgi:hypothetical protein
MTKLAYPPIHGGRAIHLDDINLPDATLRASISLGWLTPFTIGRQKYVMSDELREAIHKLGMEVGYPLVKPNQTQPNQSKENVVALYRHFDSDGVLLYVGIAVDPTNRLKQHLNVSHWRDSIVRVEIERHPTREAALAAELEAIRTEKPLHNIAGRVAA